MPLLRDPSAPFPRSLAELPQRHDKWSWHLGACQSLRLAAGCGWMSTRSKPRHPQNPRSNAEGSRFSLQVRCILVISAHWESRDGLEARTNIYGECAIPIHDTVAGDIAPDSCSRPPGWYDLKLQPGRCEDRESCEVFFMTMPEHPKRCTRRGDWNPRFLSVSGEGQGRLRGQTAEGISHPICAEKL